MARVLVVDDSAAVRSLLATRLRSAGHEVAESADGVSGSERALAWLPDVVVTDLVMNGMSGVQLCRLLRSEQATAHVPVVLLTGSSDKRSRFWARSAGAAAYLSKDKLDELVALVPRLSNDARCGAPSSAPRASLGRTAQERMSAILDAALFDAVIAGEVRALANAPDLTRLFEGLAATLSDVMSYRWVAIAPAKGGVLLVHAHPSESATAADRAKAVLPRARDWPVTLVSDDRAVPGGHGDPRTWPVVFGGVHVADLALAPTARGFGREDDRLVGVVAQELGGPLQVSALYEETRRLSTVDALTGLLNRRAFLELTERERLRFERHGGAISILLLDIDHFKRVNDTYGHAAGDAVLCAVAGVLTRIARRTDIIARWGGEEFVLALPQTGESGARIAAERVRRAIAETDVSLPDASRLRVTASIGMSSSGKSWTTQGLLADADEAMYLAKAGGRNRAEWSVSDRARA
jgi:two-component system cell cycle response regulator